jgi:hypothetical protein
MLKLHRGDYRATRLPVVWAVGITKSGFFGSSVSGAFVRNKDRIVHEKLLTFALLCISLSIKYIAVLPLDTKLSSDPQRRTLL